MPQNDARFEGLESQIGYRFTDPELLRKATTHGSFSAAGQASYERLEFLGDSVVGLVIAQKLFLSAANDSKGRMTAVKSDAVSRRRMAQAAARLGLQAYLRVDRGLEQRGDYPASLIAEAYEALIGAIFLDGGFEEARQVVLRTLGPELKAAQKPENGLNYKAALQELLQAQGKPLPGYRTVKKEGPDHQTRFLVAVRVGNVEQGEGWGTTKKEAEQRAAARALNNLRRACRGDAS